MAQNTPAPTTISVTVPDVIAKRLEKLYKDQAHYRREYDEYIGESYDLARQYQAVYQQHLTQINNEIMTIYKLLQQK